MGETKTAGISNTFKLEAEDENKSVLKLHANHHHNGAEVRFSTRVTGVHNDSLDRQVTALQTSEDPPWRILDESTRRVRNAMYIK